MNPRLEREPGPRQSYNAAGSVPEYALIRMAIKVDSPRPLFVHRLASFILFEHHLAHTIRGTNNILEQKNQYSFDTHSSMH